MSVTTQRRVLTVALIGNPNTGKSTLFNALCGARQRVGNYPGVTVELKLGRMQIDDRRFSLVDLPGTYSLAPRSPDEMITIDVLLGRRRDVPEPDVVLCILDAANLQRNLYLVSQVLELGRPTIVALNMMDSAASRQMQIDVPRLSRQLGVPVVPLQAHRRIGLRELHAALAAAIDGPPRRSESPFPEPFQRAVDELGEAVAVAAGPLPRYLVERLLLDTSGYLADTYLKSKAPQIGDTIAAVRRRLADVGCAVPAVEAVSRYAWVSRMLDGVVTHPARRPFTFGDRIDRVLTHKLFGTLIFLLVMAVVFQAVFAWAKVPMDAIDAARKALGDQLALWLPRGGAIQSLVVKGILPGVGNVIVFLPQIFILFLFIAILEDCGYMARAAYLMDRLMSCVGLSGKSFIPLLSSFACAIPGIMAARVIENRRDRLITVLVAPLMSCSARLPVYILLTAAFIPERGYCWGLLSLSGLTMLSMYLVGMVAAAGMAFFLRKTFLRGATPPFVMELPSYKVPSPRLVLFRAGDRGWAFVRRAGTLIFAVSVIVWAAGYYPRHIEQIEGAHRQEASTLAQQIAQLQNRGDRALSDADQHQLAVLREASDELQKKLSGEHLRQSFLGMAGRFIEPAVKPLGWDWRIGCAAIASFPAREVVVGTLGVIYNLGDDVNEESVPLREKLKSATWDGQTRPVFNVPVALSLMVFFALCAQCASTLVILKRETGSWRWPAFTFFYMTSLAYVGALVTYQVGIRLIS